MKILRNARLSFKFYNRPFVRRVYENRVICVRESMKFTRKIRNNCERTKLIFIPMFNCFYIFRILAWSYGFSTKLTEKMVLEISNKIDTFIYPFPARWLTEMPLNIWNNVKRDLYVYVVDCSGESGTSFLKQTSVYSFM